MKWLGLASLFVVFALGVVSAQESEGFEDETPGADPSDTWYSYTDAGTAGDSVVSTAEALEGSQSLEITLSINGLQTDLFEITAGKSQPDFIEFAIFTTCESGGTSSDGVSVLAQEVSNPSGSTAVGFIDVGYNGCTISAGDGGVGTTIGTSSNGWHVYRLIFDYGAMEYDVTMDDVNIASNLGFGSNDEIGFIAILTDGPITGDSIYFDALGINESIVSTPIPPSQISGLSGIVTELPDPQGKIRFTWPISDNDPDSEVGEYEYRLYRDGIFTAVDPITALDGNGIRVFDYAEGAGGIHTYAVLAYNTTLGLEGPISCTIVIDEDELSDAASCGDQTTPSGSGGTIGDPTFPGLDIDDTSAALGISSSALAWFLGLIIIAACTVAFVGLSKGRAPGIFGGMGAVVGLGVSIGFSLIPIWFAVFAALLALAALVLFRR